MVVHGVEQSTMGHAFWGVLMSGGVGSVVFSTVPLFHATVAAAICAGIQSEALITTADLCGVISANETADDCVHPSAALHSFPAGLVFLLVLRATLSYGRYWGAVTHIVGMGSFLEANATQVATFVQTSDAGEHTRTTHQRSMFPGAPLTDCLCSQRRRGGSRSSCAG